MKKIKILLVTMLFACTANATVITDLSERDWMVTGDKYLTFDQSTGLEWLDLTVTLGNSILDTEAMSLFGEFRWATNFEIDGILDSVLFGAGARSSANTKAVDNAQAFAALLGITNTTIAGVSDSYGVSRAAIKEVPLGTPAYGLGLVRVSPTHAWVLDPSYNCCWSEKTSSRYVGAWLVRSTVDVPEPSTLAIFALGLMGLASRRFKKQS